MSPGQCNRFYPFLRTGCCRVHLSILAFPGHRLDTSRLWPSIFYGTTSAERFARSCAHCSGGSKSCQRELQYALLVGASSARLPQEGARVKAAAARMSRALLPGALISVTLEPPAGANCNRLVEVSVSGEYNYFFYQLLRAMGNTIPDTLNIVRSTSMRWEHQSGCQT